MTKTLLQMYSFTKYNFVFCFFLYTEKCVTTNSNVTLGDGCIVEEGVAKKKKKIHQMNSSH